MEESIAEACESVAPVLGHYDRDELAREEIRAVREHLAACGTCRHRLVVERTLGEVLRDLRRADVPQRLEWRVRRLLMDARGGSRPEV